MDPKDKIISFWITINVIVVSLVLICAFTWVSNRLIRFIKVYPKIWAIIMVAIGLSIAFQTELISRFNDIDIRAIKFRTISSSK